MPNVVQSVRRSQNSVCKTPQRLFLLLHIVRLNAVVYYMRVKG